MKYIWQRKIQRLLFLLVACCFLAACGNEAEESDTKADKNTNTEKNTDKETDVTPSAEDSASVASKPSSPQTEEDDYIEPSNTPTPTPLPRFHAIIYDNQSKGIKIELDISEGESVSLDRFAQLSGYNFVGCYDTQDEEGEKYIDANGLVCTELVSDVLLYAHYEPEIYTFTFTCNGKKGSQYGLQDARVAYDADIREFLPLNRIINENELIYSVSYNGRTLTDITKSDKIPLNETTLQDFKSFVSGSKITLDLKTVTVSQEKHFGTQEVCIKDAYNQFEQRFKDEYICDSMSFSNIDFELLEMLGFNTAIINITCGIREKDDGKQEIYVYQTAYESKIDDTDKQKKQKAKDMEDFLLAEEKHDCKKTGVDETKSFKIEVPLSRLRSGTGIYVYYGASGLGDDDWYRVYTDISLRFEQRLDK